MLLHWWEKFAYGANTSQLNYESTNHSLNAGYIKQILLACKKSRHENAVDIEVFESLENL